MAVISWCKDPDDRISREHEESRTKKAVLSISVSWGGISDREVVADDVWHHMLSASLCTGSMRSNLIIRIV